MTTETPQQKKKNGLKDYIFEILIGLFFALAVLATFFDPASSVSFIYQGF